MIEVTLLGTGSPMVDPNRAGPATLVRAGGQTFLVDAGLADQLGLRRKVRLDQRQQSVAPALADIREELRAAGEPEREDEQREGDILQIGV